MFGSAATIYDEVEQELQEKLHKKSWMTKEVRGI